MFFNPKVRKTIVNGRLTVVIQFNFQAHKKKLKSSGIEAAGLASMK